MPVFLFLAPVKGDKMSPTRIEVREPNGISISVTELAAGDSLSYPIIPRKIGTQELVVIFPNGTYNHCIRTKLGFIQGPWNSTNQTIMPGESQEFPVPPDNRLIIKNI